MRSSLARRAAVFGTAALLLLGPATQVAGAQPAQEPGVSAAAQLPAALRDALANDLELTPEQYLERSALAQQLARFAADARAQFPDAFAGAWMNEDGAPVVGLAGPDRAPARAAVEQAGFTAVDVEHSQRELEDVRNALVDWIGTLSPQLSALVHGVSVDIATNTVLVRATDTAGTLFDLLPSFLREAARVVLAPAFSSLDPTLLGPDVAYFLSDAFLGGDAYTAVGGGFGLRCSLGFNAADQAGNPVNITAGHCDPSPHSAGTEFASVATSSIGDIQGPTIGRFEKTVTAGADYAIVRPLPASARQFTNNGIRVPTADPLYVTGTADPVVGAPVCKAGSTSGYECGVVTAVDRRLVVGEGEAQRVLDNAFTTDLCGIAGDSGGPLVTGTLALGIASASNVGHHPSCDIARTIAIGTGKPTELSATPINTILRANPGLTVRTS